MTVNTSLSTCLAIFFWTALGTLIFKIVTGVRSALVDGVFVVLSILVMLIVFASIMKDRCGTAPFGSVLNAVLWPWLFMLGGVVLITRLLPGSNLFRTRLDTWCA